VGGVPLGGILWAMTGNPMPPFFDVSCFAPEKMQTWVKDGDVIVRCAARLVSGAPASCSGLTGAVVGSTAAKSGTNWMLYLAHLIRTRGNVDMFPFVDVLAVTPWFALKHHPSQTCTKVIDNYHNSSHTTSDGLRLRGKARNHRPWPRRNMNI
jgi:hypothetical protein